MILDLCADPQPPHDVPKFCVMNPGGRTRAGGPPPSAVELEDMMGYYLYLCLCLRQCEFGCPGRTVCSRDCKCGRRGRR